MRSNTMLATTSPRDTGSADGMGLHPLAGCYTSNAVGLLKRKQELSPVSQSCPNLPRLLRDHDLEGDAMDMVSLEGCVSEFGLEFHVDDRQLSASSSHRYKVARLRSPHHSQQQPRIRSHLSITLPQRGTQRQQHKSHQTAAVSPLSPVCEPSPQGPSPRLPPTPCDYGGGLSCGRLGPRDAGYTLELIRGGRLWDPAVCEAASAAAAGLAGGKRPVQAVGCVSGTYYLPGPSGRFCALFKPVDEEAASSGLIKGGIGGGECAVRECIAWLLDEAGIAGVPPTAMARAWAEGFRGQGEKLGSLQVYVRHECSAEDMGPSLFSLSDVQAIALLDIRLCNQDRHCGNMLVQSLRPALSNDDSEIGAMHRAANKSPPRVKLIPIDHGFCLPHPASMSDTDFAWLQWPQSQQPLNAWQRAHVASLDAEEDIRRLREALGDALPAEEHLMTLRIGTTLLQKGVAAGLTLNSIGLIMTREDPDVPCNLEEAVGLALRSASLQNAAEFMGVLSPILDAVVQRARDEFAKAGRSLSA